MEKPPELKGPVRQPSVDTKADEALRATAGSTSNQPAREGIVRRFGSKVANSFNWVKDKTFRSFDWFRNTRFGRVFLDVLYETAVMVLWLGAVKVMHIALDRWIGKDSTLWNSLKIGYIIDTGHALAIGKFLLELLKHFLEGLKDVIRVIRNLFRD